MTASTSGDAAPPMGGSSQRADIIAQRRVLSTSTFAGLPFSSDPAGTVKVIIQVAGESVASAEGLATESGKAFTRSDEATVKHAAKAAQDRVAALVTSHGGRVERRHVTAINAMTVDVRAGDLGALAASIDVVNITPVRTYRRDNGAANAFTGVAQAWQGGLTGAGVRIAIIDDGVDYTHADFGGPGTAAAYSANDRTTLADGGFAGSKVIGGWDFVGDGYDSTGQVAGSTTVPAADPDPLACGEHGTHVAGTAAGFGVLTDGSTYEGSYDDALSAGLFSVAPGAAPEAQLLAYKVFGCGGATDTSILVAAIDQAVADGAQVINISLGSAFGYATDADAVAADNAVRSGVVVVVAAGNENNGPYVVGAPSAGKRVISVAAVDASADMFPGAVIASTDNSVSAQVINANNADLGSGLTGSITVVRDNLGNLSTGCVAADFPTTLSVPNTVFLVRRGGCNRVDKPAAAQAAGGIGLVMVNDEPGLPPFEGTIAGVTIPFLGADFASSAIIETLDGMEVTVTASPIANPAYSTVAGFSSGGPRSGDSGVKPDVAAPGVSILSAAVGSGNQAIVLSGTSMATPHTAGIAALVIQRNPTWSATDVKAALIGTADPARIREFNTRTAGNGLVNPLGAITTPAVLVSRGGVPAVEFGMDELDGSFSEAQPMKLKNLGDAPVTYDLATSWNSDPLDAVVSVSPNRVTLAPGKSADLVAKLKLSKSAAALLPQADAAGGLTTLQGQIVATPTNPALPVVRAVFLSVPHPRSNIEVIRAQLHGDGDSGHAGAITLRNASFYPGIADVYDWLLGDTRNPRSLADSRAVGVQYYDLQDPNYLEPLLVFAFADFDIFSSPNEQYQDVLLDVDDDGTPDAELLVGDEGFLTGGDVNGVLASFAISFATDSVVELPASAAPDGSVILAYALPSDLGITPTSGPALIRATTGALADGTTDDFTGVASVNPFDQPTTVTDQTFVVPAKSTAQVGVTSGNTADDELPPLGWMIVTLDDRSGVAQAELVRG